MRWVSGALPTGLALGTSGVSGCAMGFRGGCSQGSRVGTYIGGEAITIRMGARRRCVKESVTHMQGSDLGIHRAPGYQ